MNMKRILVIICAFIALQAFAQEQKPAPQKVNNRYSVRLKPKDGGGFTVDSRTRELLGDAMPEDFLEPYSVVPVVPSSIIADVPCQEIVYKKYGDREVKLFIAPAVGASEPTPVVCLIHGGGWSAGSPDGFAKRARYIAKFAGLAGVSIGYSLMQKDDSITIEDTMNDLRDAVKYIKQHAKEFNIDPSRFAFAGHSAGGHLAAMMAMTEPCAKVLSGWSGPYDLEAQMNYWTDGKKHRTQHYFLGMKASAVKKYSPVHVIPKKRQVAVQLFNGTCDPLVHHSQAENFAAALEKAGQKTVELLIYPYYGHGLNNTSDKNRECQNMFIKFVKAHIYD